MAWCIQETCSSGTDVKDARLYKDTEGWGWGRWRGLDLKPYGDDARFVTMTSCHQPMRRQRLRLFSHHNCKS